MFSFAVMTPSSSRREVALAWCADVFGVAWREFPRGGGGARTSSRLRRDAVIGSGRLAVSNAVALAVSSGIAHREGEGGLPPQASRCR